MNKIKSFFSGLCIFGLPGIALWGIIFLLEDNKKNQYVCIEDYIYMRVENSLLIYPSPSDAMRCEVFEYIEANKKEVKK